MTKWDPTMTIGVAEIDAQHQELFRRADLLDVALVQGQSVAVVGITLLYLRGYCQDHFACEERLMLDRGYPAAAKHLSEHAWFTKQLESLQREIAAQGSSEALALRLSELMSHWLVTHVGTTDLAFGAFVRGH